MRAFSEQYQLGTLQQTLKFVAGPLDAAHSSITLNPDKPVVGGTLTAIWSTKDANDNPVTSLTPEAPSLAVPLLLVLRHLAGQIMVMGRGLRRLLSALRRVN
ncbi:hypothetical protein OIU92_10835 [Escherichia coli]|nr:hypothetical protein [Escherichia coli]